MAEYMYRSKWQSDRTSEGKRNDHEIFGGGDQKWMATILSITNKMQRYTTFFIIVSALHVSGGFSAHHQELKNSNVFELMKMGGENARNMYSIDNNKEYCITLCHVGYTLKEYINDARSNERRINGYYF